LDNWEILPLPAVKLQGELDRWILSEFNLLVKNVEQNLQKYILDVPVKQIADFVDKFTNWYLRRSRRKFWAEGMDEVKQSAYWTLTYVFEGLLKVMAPYAPFVPEWIWLEGKKEGLLWGEQSIHLEGFPVWSRHWINKQLMDEINLVRKIVRLGLYVRAKNKIPVKQPLKTLYIKLD